MRVKFCSECGFKLPELPAKFCPDCGYKLEGLNPSPPSASTPVDTAALTSRARDLASQGELLAAEDLYWTAINAGFEEAKLELALDFQYEAALNSLALQLYRELLQSGFERTALMMGSVAMILLDVHAYQGARSMLEGRDREAVQGTYEAIEAEELKALSYIADVPDIVSGLLVEEAQLESRLLSGPSLDVQLQFFKTRMYLAHYATVLASGISPAISVASVEVPVPPVTSGLKVTRLLSAVLQSPASYWFRAAHAGAIAFSMIYETSGPSDPRFPDLVKEVQKYIEKKYVIAGRGVTEGEEERVLLNNLIAGLGEIGHPAKDFYGHLLGE